MSALRRFFVPPHAIDGDRLSVQGAEAHHLGVVVRLRPGDQFIAVDGSAMERVVEIEAVSKEAVRGRILGSQPGARVPVLLAILQGIPKGGKMDTVVRTGTELGVAQFVPIHTRRSIGSAGSRVPRWGRIAIEATKQSRRADIPFIADPMGLAAALELVAGYDRILLLWEGEQVRSIAEGLVASPTLHRVAIIVGPEGGLDPAEVALASRAGAISVTLGPFVVRTEHAALVAAAMVIYEAMSRGGSRRMGAEISLTDPTIGYSRSDDTE